MGSMALLPAGETPTEGTRGLAALTARRPPATSLAGLRLAWGACLFLALGLGRGPVTGRTGTGTGTEEIGRGTEIETEIRTEETEETGRGTGIGGGIGDELTEMGTEIEIGPGKERGDKAYLKYYNYCCCPRCQIKCALSTHDPTLSSRCCSVLRICLLITQDFT